MQRKIWAFLAVAMIGALAPLAGQASAQAGTGATIEVQMLDTAGNPVAGAGVDLFGTNATGDRWNWLGYVTTDANGGGRFETNPGCYVTTFIAPQGSSFANKTGFENQNVCVDSGGTSSAVAQLAYDQPLYPITFGARDTDGSIAYGVQVDLFTMAADGSRQTFVESKTTRWSGPINYNEFRVEPGCWVLTFVAPEGATFAPDGSSWRNVPICIENRGDGAVVRFLAEVVSTVSIEITDSSGAPQSDVDIDLFAGTAFGNRTEWQRSTTTGPDGRATFDVSVGCWVLTAIAPPTGAVFAETGTPYINRVACVDPNISFESEPAVLLPSSATRFRAVGAVANFDGSPAVGLRTELNELENWSVVGVADTGSTGEDGGFEFEFDPGCWRISLEAPEGVRFTTGGRYAEEILCVAFGDPNLIELPTYELDNGPVPEGELRLDMPAVFASRNVTDSWAVSGDPGVWEGGIYNHPLLSGDGSTAAYVTGFYGKNNGVAIRSVDTGTVTQIIDNGYSASAKAISRDGSSVLFSFAPLSEPGAGDAYWWRNGTTRPVSEGEGKLTEDGAALAAIVDDSLVLTSFDGSTESVPLPPEVRGRKLISADRTSVVYQWCPCEEVGGRIGRWDRSTDEIAEYDNDEYTYQISADGRIAQISRVGWFDLTTGEHEIADWGWNESWFTYNQDFDLSGDGSTLVYPLLPSLYDEFHPAALYRPASSEVIGLPLTGDEEFIDISDDGRTILFGSASFEAETWELGIMTVE